MPEIQTILEFVIIGAFLSAIVDPIKSRLGVSGNKTKLLVVALSLIFAGAYWVVVQSVYYENVIYILGAASTIYALLMRK